MADGIKIDNHAAFIWSVADLLSRVDDLTMYG
jgi:hypothetical protein